MLTKSKDLEVMKTKRGDYVTQIQIFLVVFFCNSTVFSIKFSRFHRKICRECTACSAVKEAEYKKKTAIQSSMWYLCKQVV